MDALLKFAQQTAESQQTNRITSEHLLLGLLQEEGSFARSILVELEPEPGALEKAILERLPKTHESVSQFTLAPSVREALNFALDEARGRGNNFIATEHLLLGLMRQKGTIAIQAIESLGIVQKTILSQLEEALKSSTSNWFDLSSMPVFAVLTTAQQEAKALKNAVVAPEHLLLALNVLECEPTKSVVQALRLDNELLRYHIQKIQRTMLRGEHDPTFSHETQIVLRHFSLGKGYANFPAQLLRELLAESWALADLWRSAGVTPEKLQPILDEYHVPVKVSSKPRNALRQLQDIGRAYGLDKLIRLLRRIFNR